jgi:hypothetical protein
VIHFSYLQKSKNFGVWVACVRRQVKTIAGWADTITNRKKENKFKSHRENQTVFL